jgi:hypothetical protein
MTPARPESQCPTSTKVELVLRLLGGETLMDLSRQTGRPQKQLSVWRRRFLVGGEAYLDARPNPEEIQALRDVRDQLSVKVTELKSENRMLERGVALLGRDRSGRSVPHPWCSEAYARAFEEPGVQALRVPEWGTHVLVRDGRWGTRQATGIKPHASLNPGCDLRAGLETLRQHEITSVSLVTDPMWCPDVAALQQAFDACHTFKQGYLVEREERVRIHKRHRNRINQARRAGKVREVSLVDHLERWLELYQQNVTKRRIPQPFSPVYFERLAELPGLRTVAVFVEDEMVTITIWMAHQDTLYFHDAASSATGHATSASYVAFAHVIENANDFRYLFFGGSADFYEDSLDGLARFKRGFSNGSLLSYLCSATLNRPADE